MKILVDKMPYFFTDCPFYDGEHNLGTCKGSGCTCMYFKMDHSGERGRKVEDCDFFMPLSEVKKEELYL